RRHTRFSRDWSSDVCSSDLIILQLPSVEQVFEEKFINWQLDKEVLQALVAKTFKNFSSVESSNNHLAELTPNWDEDREFILDLFILAVSHSDEYQSFISGKRRIGRLIGLH